MLLVIGAGAVGGFYASKYDDQQIALVCRSNYESIQAQQGIYIHSRYEPARLFKPFKIYSSISDTLNDFYNVILIATKSFVDLTLDLKPLYDSSDQPRTLLLIQNGIDIEQKYAQAFPKWCILTCSTTISCAQTKPGEIHHYKWTRISIGPFATKYVNEEQGLVNAHEIKRRFTRGGIPDAFVYSSIDIQRVRWHKLIINAAVSPTSILSGGLGTSEIAADPLLLEHLRQCMLEIKNAGEIILKTSFPESWGTVDAILNSIKTNTGSKPSMLLDWEENRPLELNEIVGNLLIRAKEAKLNLVRVECMFQLLQSQLKCRRKAKL